MPPYGYKPNTYIFTVGRSQPGGMGVQLGPPYIMGASQEYMNGP